MKIYKVNRSTKIFFILFSIFIIAVAIIALLDNNAPIIIKLMAPLGLIICIAGFYGLYKIRIIINKF